MDNMSDENSSIAPPTMCVCSFYSSRVEVVAVIITSDLMLVTDLLLMLLFLIDCCCGCFSHACVAVILREEKLQ